MKTNHILLTAALLLSAASCTKEATEIPDTADDNTLYPVTFSGGIDLVQTKADNNNTTPMRKDVKAKVYVYKSDATVADVSSPVNKEYKVGNNGDLTIGTSDTIYLAKDTYKFYAVSTDSITESTDASSFPAFTSGVSAELSNGFNYLWAKSESKVITGTPDKQNVELKFERKAVKIVINIESGANNGITLKGWMESGDSAKITPPKVPSPNTSNLCKMTLSTGVIAPATSVDADSPVKMTCGEVESNKATVSYIMLPLIDDSNKPVPTVTLRVKVQNTGESADGGERTYKTQLNYPSGGFESGKQYTYTATLKANGITFTGTTVTDWAPVTFNNGEGDLTPTEPDSN
ncbi:MAG: fimbrillin family protein [Parabacteroides sp.]|nr:fimbrillin family protein [Parabacteroides sp.]